MNIIQGTFLVNGQPRNGVVVKLWREEAFAAAPALDTAEPTDAEFQVGASITTGTAHGGLGSYRFTGLADGSYYVSFVLPGGSPGKAIQSGGRPRTLTGRV